MAELVSIALSHAVTVCECTLVDIFVAVAAREAGVTVTLARVVAIALLNTSCVDNVSTWV
jgi:hypothetical protein